MGDYEIEWTLEMLFTAKHLYDVGKMDDLMAVLTDFTDGGEFTFDFDMAPLLYEAAIGLIFEETRVYYNEETQQTTFVFWDTILYRYNTLCRAYEARYGIAEIENHYVKKAEKAIHSAMTFGCMDYDYTWKTGTKHPKDSKLVWIEGVEFCHIYEVPRGLIELMDFYTEGVARLEAELYPAGGKVIQLPQPVKAAPRKKAA